MARCNSKVTTSAGSTPRSRRALLGTALLGLVACAAPRTPPPSHVADASVDAAGAELTQLRQVRAALERRLEDLGSASRADAAALRDVWDAELALSVALASLEEREAALAAGVDPGEGGAIDAQRMVDDANARVEHVRREQQYKRAYEEAQREEKEAQARSAAEDGQAAERRLREELARAEAEDPWHATPPNAPPDENRPVPDCNCAAGDPLCSCAPSKSPPHRCAAGDPLCDDGAPSGVGAASVVASPAAPSSLMPFVEQQLPRLTACFPDEVRAEGVELSVRARLGEDGSLREPRITSSSELGPRVEACLTDALRAVRAGPQAVSTIVTFPLWLR